MSKEEKAETRVIYKRDPELTREGFEVFQTAKDLESELTTRYPEPGHRIRVRMRSRTNTWDVVVKVRTEVRS